MPVHWYYNTERLEADYGLVDRYLAPRNPHPDSILWRSHYEAPNPKGEILHDQARFWGQRGVHYHQFLEAGENTVNLKLNRLLAESLEDCGGYDESNFLARYIDFLTTPGSHRDTYLEEYHRNFFMRYAKGVSPERCATEEKHIGGLSFIYPVIGYWEDDWTRGREEALKRLRSTHPGPKMEASAGLLLDLLEAVLSGTPLSRATEDLVRRQGHPMLGLPWNRLLEMDTRTALVRGIGTVCYVEQALPAVFYLCWKHGDDPERALVENTMAGGDNCYRGATLGGLLAAAHGVAGFPEGWVKGLKESPGLFPEREV